MVHNRTFKVFCNLTLLVIFCTGQVAAAPITSAGQLNNKIGESFVSAGMYSSQVMFIENVGQMDNDARFQVRGSTSTIWLAEDAFWVTLTERPVAPESHSTLVGKEEFALFFSNGSETVHDNHPGKGVNIKLSFVGANPTPSLEPFNRMETHISYFLGNNSNEWRVDVPTWGGVLYKDLYPGIDLEITSKNGRLVQRLVVRESKNLSMVQLRVDGAEEMTLDGDHVLLKTDMGEYVLPLLQVSSTGHQKYSLPTIIGKQILSPFGDSQNEAENINPQFGVADLLYSTFLGGGSHDIGASIAVDASGAAFITGETQSPDFPTTPGAFDSSLNGNSNGYVAKLNAEGSDLIYATFLGGSGNDDGKGIDIDNSGSAYITGTTNSSDFPTTPGAFDTNSTGYIGGSSAFVVKLNRTGSTLIYSTLIEGSCSEISYDIAIDIDGAAYITGNTCSFSDFPTTPGAIDTHSNHINNPTAFVAKLNAAGSALNYSTFLEGNSDGSNLGTGIAINPNGEAYIVGWTSSFDFPATVGAFDTSYDGAGWDIFVAKLNVNGSALTYSTFLGGSGRNDRGMDIAIDADGAAYITGETNSSDFPTTLGAFDTTYNSGVNSAFVTKLNPAGSALSYSTFLEGSKGSEGEGIAIDSSGAAYITGGTTSPDFPTTSGAFDTSISGGYDAFVAKLTPAGSALFYSSFLGGGSDMEQGHDISIHASGAAYITGETYSADFPTTTGSFDISAGGNNDAFVAKLAVGDALPAQNPPLIIVHGFQGVAFDGIAPAGYSCDQGIQRYDPDTQNSTLNSEDGSTDLADWLANEGHDVWIAHLESNPLRTYTLEKNAECLRDQIKYADFYNHQPITIIAHSMGGLVSRAAINTLPSSDVDIDALFTLGSPHAGIPFALITLGWGETACILQPAVCEMKTSNMNGFYAPWSNLLLNNPFNLRYPNRSDVRYYFIGGNGGTDMFSGILGRLGHDPNDGLVGQHSAVGWLPDGQVFEPYNWTGGSMLGQFFTNETHPNQMPADKAYYLAQDGQGYSDSFGCLKAVINGNLLDPNHCWPAGSPTPSGNSIEADALSASISSFTEIKTGHLNAGQIATLPFVIDGTDTTLFYLDWSGGAAPSFTLTRPDTQVIDPPYAAAHPGEVNYETAEGSPEILPNAAYNFVSGQVGTWYATITATDDINYKIFGIVDGDPHLTAQTDAELYQIGDTATITANLDSAGIGLAGASVQATLLRSDSVIDVVPLADQGNGIYSAPYTIPDAPGYLPVVVIANGNNSGSIFARQENLLMLIASDDLQLTDTYSDIPIDDNSDGFYEKLNFNAEVNLVSDGEYAIMADLYAGNQFITQVGDFFDLTAGTQTITLSFDGVAIRQAMLDGPYSITNLSVTPLDTGITAQSAANIHTTSNYSYAQFGAHPCYILALGQIGLGGNLLASPINSNGCNANEYVDGESIELTASPAVGWAVGSWTGTGNDASTATINTLLMPAGSHSVTVNYKDVTPPAVLDSVSAGTNPTSAANVDFTVIFSKSVTGVDMAAPFTDFDLTTSLGITGAFVAGVTPISETTYTVSVNTGSGNGTIRLDVSDDNSIVDAALNPLGGAGLGDGDFTDGEVYSIIKSATFADVPLSYWSNSSIERLYNAGITGGCTTVPLNYCPATPVTRSQMAIFLLRGMHGSTYTPPAATGTKFTDVPLGTFGAAWIEQLATEGITSGCGGGNYCPTTPVSRVQMAIFLVRAKHGITFTPPTATGLFTDVPVGSFGADYIEQLSADAITSGCGGTNYCPNTTVKRDSMAVFLVKTFNLP